MVVTLRTMEYRYGVLIDTITQIGHQDVVAIQACVTTMQMSTLKPSES